jgi:hypothetical protein
MHLGAKCRITIHAADTLQEVHSIAAAPKREMCDLSYSPDGKQLAAASCDGVVMLTDADKPNSDTAAPDNSALLQEATVDGVVDGWGRNLGFVRFSADGQRLATACGDRTVRVWDPSNRRECSPPLTHPAHITALSFSPDRNYILTSSLDNLGHLGRSLRAVAAGQSASPECDTQRCVSSGWQDPVYGQRRRRNAHLAVSTTKSTAT